MTLDLRRATESLREVTSLRRARVRPIAGAAVSLNPLEISTVATATTARSSAEVNTIPTSFSPRGPSFSGSSTSDPTIDGVYDGTHGDDTLTFQASTGGVVGVSFIRIMVRDGLNQTIDAVDFSLGYTPGTKKTLQNGLELSLSAGTVGVGETFQVDVSTSVGSRVDPTKPFNGTRNQNPNFEPSFGVSSGVFELNDTPINVAADDSIQSILAKISASSAGLTATFDSLNERVVLSQQNLGSLPTIDIGTDTSGFLAATKLANPTITAGSDDDRTRKITEVAAFAGISTGTFRVNHGTFTVDVLNDSLNDVMTRINQAGVQATASLDTLSRVFRIAAAGSSSLSIDDETSGFFTALGATPGTFDPKTRAPRESAFKRPDRIQKKLDEFGDAFNTLFGTEFSPTAAPAVGSIQSTLRQALVRGFSETVANSDADVLRAYGLEFRFDAPGADAFDVDRSALRRTLERDPKRLASLLGSENGDGLLDLLDGAFDDIAKELDRYLGRDATGLLLDLKS